MRYPAMGRPKGQTNEGMLYVLPHTDTADGGGSGTAAGEIKILDLRTAVQRWTSGSPARGMVQIGRLKRPCDSPGSSSGCRLLADGPCETSVGSGSRRLTGGPCGVPAGSSDCEGTADNSTSLALKLAVALSRVFINHSHHRPAGLVGPADRGRTSTGDHQTAAAAQPRGSWVAPLA